MTPSDIKHHQRRVLVFGNWVSRISRYGCSDGHCKIRVSRGGMHTNGGCKCYRSLTDYAIELADSSDKLRDFRGIEPLDETPEQAEDALNSLGA